MSVTGVVLESVPVRFVSAMGVVCWGVPTVGSGVGSAIVVMELGLFLGGIFRDVLGCGRWLGSCRTPRVSVFWRGCRGPE